MQIGVVQTSKTLVLYKIVGLKPVSMNTRELRALYKLRSTQPLFLVQPDRKQGTSSLLMNKKKTSLSRYSRIKPSLFMKETKRFLHNVASKVITNHSIHLWRLVSPTKKGGEIKYFLVIYKFYEENLEVAIQKFRETWETEWKPLLQQIGAEW